MVLNPFPAFVCPNSNLLEGFWAENLKVWLKIWPKTGKNPGRPAEYRQKIPDSPTLEVE